MDAGRWSYLKSLGVPEPRTFWLSGTTRSLHSRTVNGSYDVGRNESKRADRKADIKARKIARMVR